MCHGILRPNVVQGGQKTRMAQSGPKVISPNMALTYVFLDALASLKTMLDID